MKKRGDKTHQNLTQEIRSGLSVRFFFVCRMYINTYILKFVEMANGLRKS